MHHLGREAAAGAHQGEGLSEELENPLNVHRWRKLEGSDPSTFEMIQKIQTLQRLISKTEEVVEKDLLIQEKEKLYMELKAILARQPGPEVAEQALCISRICARRRSAEGMRRSSTCTRRRRRWHDRAPTRDMQDLKL